MTTRPSQQATTAPHATSTNIWWMAFGYFACYVPYTGLVKALSSGKLETTLPVTLSGIQMLPVSVMASVLGMYTCMTLLGWWKYASQVQISGISIPHPSRWLLLSGLCTSAIAVTTTLAYTFDGVSIVFVMLLMRGGVLIIAPVVDTLTGRHVRWFSYVGLLLSLLALLAAFSGDAGYAITFLCAVDIAIYLTAYFVRLRLMSRLAKADDPSASRRFFVEEQMVATPAVVLLLAVYAWGGSDRLALDLHFGFTELWGTTSIYYVALIGLFSQGTGIFGGLILLDNRENTFCVPVNRSSSILAGLAATYMMMFLLGSAAPQGSELLGAGLILSAILFLSIPPLLERQRSATKG